LSLWARVTDPSQVGRILDRRPDVVHRDASPTLVRANHIHQGGQV